MTLISLDLSAEIRTTKWHPIWGKNLAVALEATFAPHITPVRLADFVSAHDFERNLLYQNGNVIRVYHPAILTGDPHELLEISFLAVVDMEECQYLRLCLRGMSIPSEIQFAREGEEKTFGFTAKKPYINLDFQSKCQFRPLFIRRVPDEFFVIQVQEASEGRVSLLMTRADIDFVPKHLIS